MNRSNYGGGSGIVLDACRADHLSSYGYARDTSPFLDQLAARGLRFSHAFVNTHGTPPSHTTMLTSLYQETHGVGLGAGAAEGKADRQFWLGIMYAQLDSTDAA